jgi:hypothetical protein
MVTRVAEYSTTTKPAPPAAPPRPIKPPSTPGKQDLAYKPDTAASLTAMQHTTKTTGTQPVQGTALSTSRITIRATRIFQIIKGSDISSDSDDYDTARRINRVWPEDLDIESPKGKILLDTLVTADRAKSSGPAKLGVCTAIGFGLMIGVIFVFSLPAAPVIVVGSALTLALMGGAVKDSRGSKSNFISRGMGNIASGFGAVVGFVKGLFRSCSS